MPKPLSEYFDQHKGNGTNMSKCVSINTPPPDKYLCCIRCKCICCLPILSTAGRSSLCFHQLAASCSVVDRHMTFGPSSISLTPSVSVVPFFVLVDSCCLADVICQVVSLYEKKKKRENKKQPRPVAESAGRSVARRTVTVGFTAWLGIQSVLFSSQVLSESVGGCTGGCC